MKPIDGRRLTQFFRLENEKAFWRPFEFYFQDKDGVPHTLSRHSRKSIYYKKITEVAWQIKLRLEQIKEQLVAEPSPDGTAQVAVNGPFSGMRVLLGEKDEQLGDEWEATRQLLLNDGVEVIPRNGEYPSDDAGLVALLKRELPRSDLFIQLLNPLSESSHRADAEARQIPAPAKTHAQLSFDCALAHLRATAKPFGILQWRDPKISRGALRYWPEELLDSAHVQAVGLEQFKRSIRAKLEDLRKPPPPSATSKPFLFIAADQADLDLATKLQEAALDHAEVDVMTETEEERKEHFIEAMKLAAGVIFVHGKAPVQFINNWLSLYVREKAKQSGKAYRSALYRAPPPKQSDQTPRIPTRDLLYLGSEETFTLDGIERLWKDHAGAACRSAVSGTASFQAGRERHLLRPR